MLKLRNLSVLLAAITVGSFAGERMTPELLWSLGRVGGPAVSPDGQWAVYSVRHYDWRENTGWSNLWLANLDSGENRQLTSGRHSDGSPSWTPDSRAVYFSSNRSGASQAYRIRLDGGEAVQVSQFDASFGNLLLAPSGDYLLFTREVKLEDNVHDMFADLPKADAKLYEDLKFRHWDSWHEGSYSHLFTAGLDGGGARDLMPGQKTDTPLKPFGGRSEIAVSPDGREICYTAIAGRPADSTDSGLYLVSKDGGEAKLITAGMNGYDVEPRYSPDGKYIAFLSMSTPGYESDRNRIMLYDRKTGQIRELTKGRDQTVSGIQWLDATTIVFNAPLKGSIQLYALDIGSGSSRQITRGRHNLSSFATGGGKLVALKSTHERPYELYRVDPKTGAMTKLTAVNDQAYAKLDLPSVEEKWVKATDGKMIHNWVIYPPNFDPAKKYPLITYCQGGPQGMVSQFFSFRWNFHLMAAQGYVVVAVNRRGLPGFGREWNDEINRDYGGQPIRDILSSADAMIQEPYIDPSRTAAVGASYGGYTVFRLMGENHGAKKRFTTMIAHCGLFNLESWYLATEELFFPNHDQGGPFWTSPEQKKMYAENSPHTYVDRWETPILVIHGEKDYRVPVTEGLQAFTAAKIRGLDAQFLYFPEENHWVLTPQNGILWHRVFYRWLAKHCKPDEGPAIQ